MLEFILITTTTGTRQDAEQIASEIMSKRLAACAQVSGPIASTFHWQGKVESQEEWVCSLKTIATHLAAVQEAIERIHPYEVPEIIAVPIVGGSQKYLEWIQTEVC